MKTFKFFIIIFFVVFLFAVGSSKAQLQVSNVQYQVVSNEDSAVTNENKGSDDDTTNTMSGENETKGPGYNYNKVDDGSVPGDQTGTGADQEMGSNENIPVNTEATNANSSAISVKAVDIRGWDDQQKQEFLQTVKEQAQVNSGQDLENFAKGVLLKDSNVDSVDVSQNNVDVSYNVPAKFLGIFPVNIKANVSLQAGTSSASSSDVNRVKVKFPWYRFLFRINNQVQANSLEQAINEQLFTLQLNVQNQIQTVAQQLQSISNVLKTKTDSLTNL